MNLEADCMGKASSSGVLKEAAEFALQTADLFEHLKIFGAFCVGKGSGLANKSFNHN